MTHLIINMVEQRTGVGRRSEGSGGSSQAMQVTMEKMDVRASEDRLSSHIKRSLLSAMLKTKHRPTWIEARSVGQ